jgi:CubicO group peptidase (beta-lactamase class C family)
MRWLLAWCVLPLAAQTYDFAAVDTLLKETRQKLGTGVALTISQNGKTIYERSAGLGMAQNIPIASSSKWLSAAVLMSVVDEGKVSLDDRLSKFLPYFTGDKASITFRQAFSHTAGFASDNVLELIAGALLRRPKSPGGCTADRSTTLDECAREIARIPLEYKPGEAFAYGQYSMQAAGRALEVATGKPFAELFEERIARPLGMTNTRTAPPLRAKNPLIAGGYSSTAADYAKFTAMILNKGMYNGKRVLSEAAVAEMQRDQTRGARIASTPYRTYDPGRRYGVGEWLECVEGGRVCAVGSQGAFGFSPWVDLDRKIAGVFAVRGRLNEVMPAYLRLREAIARAIPVQR